MRHKTVADIIVEISLAEEVKHCERHDHQQEARPAVTARSFAALRTTEISHLPLCQPERSEESPLLRQFPVRLKPQETECSLLYGFRNIRPLRYIM